MSDKTSIKIDPKQGFFIQIDDTLPDILPLLQRGLTGQEILKNGTETQHTICLSIRIGILKEKGQLPCRE